MSDNLLDIIASQDAKDEAITRVGVNADPLWITACYHAIINISGKGHPFTTDDIWEELDQKQIPAPHEPRAMGAAIREAVAQGWITATGSYHPSRRKECHARPIRVWSRCQYLPEE